MKKHPFVPFAALLAVFLPLAGGTTWATIVNGQVTDTVGTGVANVNLDFIDRDTEISIPFLDDKTDLLGFYSLNVPAGDYDVRFKPAPGVRLVGFEERGVRVEGAVLTLNQTLQSGLFVTGRVIDDLLAPVASMDLDFFDTINSETIFTPNDSTDVGGNFQVVVPASTYDIDFEPAVGTNLVPIQILNLSVTADLSLGDVSMQNGFHLTGVVRDSGILPLAGVKVLTLDPATGIEIFNIRNTTDLLGQFNIVVAPADYTLLFEPAQGTAGLPRILAGVSVSGPLALPILNLEMGVIATGNVTDNTTSNVIGVDLDMVDLLSGKKRFTPHDNTNDEGNYQVTVRPGTYDILYDPPPGSLLAPQLIRNVSLTVDSPLPIVTLPPGLAVSGSVIDIASIPVPLVDLDFLDYVTGVEVATTRDDTDLTGAFSVMVPMGTYDIKFTPPGNSGSGQTLLSGMVVNGSLSMGTVMLPASVPAFPFAITPAIGSAGGGTVVTVTGAGFAPGVKVKVGGMPLSSAVRFDSTMIQGTTRARPAGITDVEVINPGAPAAVLPGAFTYAAPAIDPVLTVARAGPLATDILLQWTDTGQGQYAVFRSTAPNLFTLADRVDVLQATSFLDQGAAQPAGIFYYVVQ